MSRSGRVEVWSTADVANAGVPQAQYEQALRCATGPERNVVFAYKWALLAATQGHPQARELRDKLRKEMTPTEIEIAEEMAARFSPKFKK